MMALFPWNKAHLQAQADEIARTIDRFAAGDLSGAFRGSSDVAARVAPAIHRLQDALVRQRADAATRETALRDEATALAAALAAMIRAHAAGAIDETIDAQALTEPYRAIAHDINALVKSHIDVKLKVVEVVSRYAHGDFSVAMDRLPGKKAQITEAIDWAKTSFESASAQAAASDTFIEALGAMSKQHELGWIDEQLAVKEFSGGYKRAAEIVNTLVSAHIAVKMRIVDLVMLYANGDFSQSMERLPGKKAQITDAMERAKSTFSAVAEQAATSTLFIQALEEMTKQHGLGSIDAQIAVDQFSGGYAHAAQLVNVLVRSHIDVKMKIVELVTNYAHGDFSQTMDRLPGKKAQITEAIDSAKSTFESVAAQAAASTAFIEALDEMTRQHKLGWIDEQIPAQAFQGGYKRAAELVNSLVRSHIDIKMKVVEIVTKYAHGDFSLRMDPLPGKKAQISDAVDAVRTMMQNSDRAVNDVVRVLSALAESDLTQIITNDYEGNLARVKFDSNATIDNLTKTVLAIKEAAEIVSTSAREISAGNADLSQRTEEQASSLEETAASIDQLTATVRQNSDNAKQANQLAVGASNIAVKGGQVVGEVVETMAAINASARKIVDIISVIDGIAFQTNILALNAAVEAARAGEQGRGFAVVAGEVRTLAQRSAAAAKEIKGLIGDSVEKTTAGSRLVDEAGSTMAEIVASVKRVTEIMGEIANASQEQGIGIEQVNEAVAQMDKVTQQNAALVEEVAVSAQGLEERASSLVGLVGVFKLGQPGSGRGDSGPDSRPARPVVHAPRRATATEGGSSANRPAVPALDENWRAF